MIDNIGDLLDVVNYLDDEFPHVFGDLGLYAKRVNEIFYVEIRIQNMKSLYRQKLKNDMEYRIKFGKYLEKYIKEELNKTITVIYVES